YSPAKFATPPGRAEIAPLLPDQAPPDSARSRRIPTGTESVARALRESQAQAFLARISRDRAGMESYQTPTGALRSSSPVQRRESLPPLPAESVFDSQSFRRSFLPGCARSETHG